MRAQCSSPETHDSIYLHAVASHCCGIGGGVTATQIAGVHRFVHFSKSTNLKLLSFTQTRARARHTEQERDREIERGVGGGRERERRGEREKEGEKGNEWEGGSKRESTALSDGIDNLFDSLLREQKYYRRRESTQHAEKTKKRMKGKIIAMMM